jgi:hypothetical protein
MDSITKHEMNLEDKREKQSILDHYGIFLNRVVRCVGDGSTHDLRKRTSIIIAYGKTEGSIYAKYYDKHEAKLCYLRYGNKDAEIVYSDEQPIEPIPDNEGEGIKDKDGKPTYELSVPFLKAMGERMAENKDKYPPYNWKKPMDKQELINAIWRHALEVLDSKFDDNGKANGHLAALACNSMMLHHQLTSNES